MAKSRRKTGLAPAMGEYDGLVGGISELLAQSRRTSAQAVNSILTATYWEIGRRIVEFEQKGEARAEYGSEMLKRLGEDLTARFGRGFGWRNLFHMRSFYQGWEILQTPSAKFEARVRLPAELLDLLSDAPTSESQQLTIFQAPSAEFEGPRFSAFPLAWSHYVRLMSVEKPHARAFYESEAIRGGWSVRQLDRQISTQFFERASKSKQQAAMLARGQLARPEDAVSAEEEIRDPYLFEFLNLKDEYSESDLEDALIEHLEAFLLELGAGFTFVARQKRIRIGTVWYRIDLLLFHRRLKCLVVIDLKIGEFTHADAGQMGLYLNYAKKHLTEADEDEPVGIILCSDKDDAVVEYAMGDMNARVFASRYLTALPDTEMLRREILETKRTLELRAATKEAERRLSSE